MMNLYNNSARPDNTLTELVFILDRSGSMYDLTGDTIGGFNSMIREQKAKPGRAVVSTVLFSDRSMVLHDRMLLDNIPVMTPADYIPDGSTALLDAIGDAVKHIRTVHRYIRPEDLPARTLFIITTDGMENSSRRYSYNDVKQLIEQQKAKGWEFLFLGANMDAVATASRFGIGCDRAVTYCCDSAGTRLNYQVVSDVVGQFRCGAPMAANWMAPIQADNQRRGGYQDQGAVSPTPRKTRRWPWQR